jgi:hypothetical protein
MGRPGTAYSLVLREELPYLLDLHLYLGRRVAPAPESPDGAAIEAARAGLGPVAGEGELLGRGGSGILISVEFGGGFVRPSPHQPWHPNPLNPPHLTSPYLHPPKNKPKLQRAPSLAPSPPPSWSPSRTI